MLACFLSLWQNTWEKSLEMRKELFEFMVSEILVHGHCSAWSLQYWFTAMHGPCNAWSLSHHPLACRKAMPHSEVYDRRLLTSWQLESRRGTRVTIGPLRTHHQTPYLLLLGPTLKTAPPSKSSIGRVPRLACMTIKTISGPVIAVLSVNLKK